MAYKRSVGTERETYKYLPLQEIHIESAPSYYVSGRLDGGACSIDVKRSLRRELSFPTIAGSNCPANWIRCVQRHVSRTSK